MACAKQHSGFILWDILISIFIISLIIIFIGNWYINITISHNNSINRLRAVNLASSILEKILITKVLDNKIAKKDIFDINFRKNRFDNNLLLYTINISWQENSKKHQIELTTAFF